MVLWLCSVCFLAYLMVRSIQQQPKRIATQIGRWVDKQTRGHATSYPAQLRGNVWPAPPDIRLLPETKNVTDARITYNKLLVTNINQRKGSIIEPKTMNYLKAYYGFPKKSNGDFMTTTEVSERDYAILQKLKKEKATESIMAKDPLLQFKNVLKPINDEVQKTKSLLGEEAKEANAVLKRSAMEGKHAKEKEKEKEKEKVILPSKGYVQADLTTSESMRGPAKASVDISTKGKKQSPTGKTIVLSAGRPVTSDVRGNLGPSSVVTNDVVTDWLKDRWQAASDMSGTPIPGTHHLEIDLERLCRVESIFIDFETAYTKHWILYGKRGDTKCDKDDSWSQVATGRNARMQKKGKQHIEQIVPIQDTTTGDGGGLDCSAPNYSQLKLVLQKPSTRFGTSIWRLHINGLEL